MYNKCFYSVLVAVFAFSAALGQEITLTGIVKDSTEWG